MINESGMNMDARIFRVDSLEKTQPPGDETKGEWWHYVIVRQSTRIDGKRAGSRESVMRHAEEYVDNLNQRAIHGYSAYAARKSRK